MNRIIGCMEVPPQQSPHFSRVELLAGVRSFAKVEKWKTWGKPGVNLARSGELATLGLCCNYNIVTGLPFTPASLATLGSIEGLTSVQAEVSVQGV